MLRAILPLLRAATSTARVNSDVRINSGSVRLMQLILIFVLCSHAFGCLWWLVATYQSAADSVSTGLEVSWTPSPWLREQELVVQYFHALLWGASLNSLCRSRSFFK